MSPPALVIVNALFHVSQNLLSEEMDNTTERYVNRVGTGLPEVVLHLDKGAINAARIEVWNDDMSVQVTIAGVQFKEKCRKMTSK